MNICISRNIVLERRDVSADNIFRVVSKFTSSKTIYCISICEMSNFLIKGVVAVIWDLLLNLWMLAYMKEFILSV